MKIREVKFIIEDTVDGKTYGAIVKLSPQLAFRQTKHDLEALVLSIAEQLVEAQKDADTE